MKGSNSKESTIMERHNAYSPSPQLKASLKFTHTPRTDPVRSGAIFRQEAQSEEGGHQQQTNLHQIAFSKGEDFHGGSEQRVQQSGKDGVQINSAAVHSRAPALSASSSALIAPASLPQHSFAPRNTAQSPVADSSAIIRPAPYGRLVPQPSPTPFGVAAWASSVGQQISANFDALVRQSPAPRVSHSLSCKLSKTLRCICFWAQLLVMQDPLLTFIR